MSDRGDDASANGRVRHVALALAALALAACASAYGRLRSETEIPECRRYIDLAAAVPHVGRLVPAGDAGGEKVRLSLEQRGTGKSDRVDVLVHGVLSDSRTWRYVAAELSGDRDVLTIDLPGCGGSDKPDPSVVGDDAYAPSAMARNVLAALREFMTTRGTRPRMTIVGHSLGTAVVLRMLGDPALRAEFADVVECVDRAVFLSPLAFAFERPDPLFERIAALTAVEVTMGEVLGILRGAVADTIWNGVEDPTRAPREEADRLFEILSAGDTRHAGQAMIRSAVPFTAEGRCDWVRIERLEDDYDNVRVPCLLVAGGRDETLPQAMAFRLRELLPRAWLRILPRAMHALPTERPQECAQLVRDFDVTGGEGWAAFDDGRRRGERGTAVVVRP